MKKTPLYTLHEKLGAKMGAFAGYSMPLFYPLGVMKEHTHTREAAGLFDISHMVHIEIIGAQASAMIERACPYDAASQYIGEAKYTFFLNENAGIKDDLIITRLGDERYLIVANAGCSEKDIAHVNLVADRFDVSVNIIPRGFLALQGPKAVDVLTTLGFDVADMDFMNGVEPKEGWFLSRTGYTGEDGFEIAMPQTDANEFAEKLLADDAVEAIGLGARDSLRLEAGLSLYSQDLTEEISPHEAGLLWAIPKSLREGGPFIGAEALTNRISNGRTRMRVGLEPVEKIPVRAGAKLEDGEGNDIGLITSGGFGPSVNHPVALGLIAVEAKEGAIFANVRGRKLEMKIARLPFAPHNYKR